MLNLKTKMPENIKTIILKTFLRSFITANKIDFEPQDIAINSFKNQTQRIVNNTNFFYLQNQAKVQIQSNAMNRYK